MTSKPSGCWMRDRTLAACPGAMPDLSDGWLLYHAETRTWWRVDYSRPDGERLIAAETPPTIQAVPFEERGSP